MNKSPQAPPISQPILALGPASLSLCSKESSISRAYLSQVSAQPFCIIYDPTRLGMFYRNSTVAAQEESDPVGRLRSFRELKQLTGVEACQRRKARIQRNHIACALLVWTRLKVITDQSGRTIDQIKHELLSNYLTAQLKRPAIAMVLAKVLTT